MLESLGVPIGHATNNAGELMAALCGLRAAMSHADENEDIILVSDSRYVLSSLFKSGSVGEDDKRPNADVLKEMHKALVRIWDKGCKLRTRWVKGHNTNKGNKMVDRLARTSAKTQQYQRVEEL